jgi:hypothetical protein
MSIVAVHGPNIMFTTQAGGTPILSSGGGVAKATKSPTNGLVYSFSVVNPGARPAADFDWTFTGPGSPVAQPNLFSGTVTYTGAGAGTIVLTVAAGAGPPAGGTYTITTAPTAGVPRMVEQGVEDEAEAEGYYYQDEDTQEHPVVGSYDPGEHTVAEVQQYVESHPDELEAVYDAEYNGKSRSTLVTWLEEQFPFDPGEYTVSEVLEYAESNPDQLEEIIEAESAGKNRSTLVNQLEAQRLA